MSLIPLLLDLEEQMAESNGYGFYPDSHRCPYLMRRYAHNPVSHWSNHYGLGSSGPNKAIPNRGKDGFEVKMNVQNFSPNEITVKVLDSNVVIEAKHEEKTDEHGSVFRHIIRKYLMPGDCELEKVISTLSSDGILTVKAPLKFQEDNPSNERIIEIRPIGPCILPAAKKTEGDSDGWPKQE